jgi:hypothetical protein
MAPKPPVSGSNKNSPDDSEKDSNELNSSGLRASDRIVLQSPLLYGYLHAPAEINININRTPNSSITSVSASIQNVNFICPELDISPLYNELKELKETLKKILDSKQLSPEIGNELVGETYLRWDTQVRFYPTIVFFFLEKEEEYLKRSLVDPSQSRKKI